MSKQEQREEIEKAMKSFKKPSKKLPPIKSREDELFALAGGDYTDYTMRLGECGIYETKG